MLQIDLLGSKYLQREKKKENFNLNFWFQELNSIKGFNIIKEEIKFPQLKKVTIEPWYFSFINFLISSELIASFKSFNISLFSFPF